MQTSRAVARSAATFGMRPVFTEMVDTAQQRLVPYGCEFHIQPTLPPFHTIHQDQRRTQYEAAGAILWAWVMVRGPVIVISSFLALLGMHLIGALRHVCCKSLATPI